MNAADDTIFGESFW